MKRKWVNGILAAVMLLCAVPTTLLAEQTDTEEEFVIKEVGVPEGTDFQPEVIGQTEDGEDIYGSYIEAPEDTDVPVLEDAELENETLTADSIPEVYNPKASGFTGGYTLPKVRDQNPYGTCWAFGSLASAEMSLARKYNVSKDLSELQLAYFTYHMGLIEQASVARF